MGAQRYSSLLNKKHISRWGIGVLLAGFLLGTFLPSFVQAASKKADPSADAGKIVISEFRTYGPYGASDEFIEIHNRTNSSIDIEDWQIKKSSGCGSASSTPLLTIGDVSLAPGQYYLIGKKPDYTGIVDAEYSSSSSVADGGGVALLDDTGKIVDQVGMCSETEYKEGNPLAELSGNYNRSYQRGENGCADTDDNATDFSVLSPSDPQRLTDTPVRCLKVINVDSDADEYPPNVYVSGETIEIEVQFSSNVNVTGTPKLLLETGATDRTATYAGQGDTDDILIFDYTVQSGDVSADLDYVSVNSLSLNGGTIIGAVGEADLTLPEPGGAGSLSDNRDIVIDNGIDNPTTISFERYDPASEFTNEDELTFRVTFSEPVKNVDTADFSVVVSPAGTVTLEVTPVNAPVYASVYDVKVTGTYLENLEGTVELDFNTVDIVDGDNHHIPNTDPTTDEIYTVDNTAPTVTVEQAVTQNDPTGVLPVEFTAVFNEEINVSTFTGDDITVSSPGAVWSITDSGDHKEFTLSAVEIYQNGAITPSIKAGKVEDLAGNGNEASTPGIDDTVTFNDGTPPTITIQKAADQEDPTNILPIEFDIQFSEPIISSIFTTADITQNGTATGITWEITNPSGDEQNFKLSATRVTEPGALQPSIAANRVTDFVGNDNLASNSDTVTYEVPPDPTSLTILINEVGWSGTAANSSHEWIELYNPTDEQYDFSTGWKLISTDYSINIELTGIISPGGYYLLEDTKDEDNDYPNNDPIRDIDADQIYSGSMSNTGEYLKLLAPDGTVVDTANKDGGSWPAGNASPNYGSMERRGILIDSSTAWITNTGVVRNGHDAEGNEINGTPKEENWAYSVLPTPSPVPTSTPIAPTRTPTPYPFQAVVLNEVLPRPGHDWNQDGVVDVNDEFIEIINRGTSDVSLSGWYLQNLETSYRLPDVNLGAGERLALYRYTTYIALSDGGGTVRLLKTSGQIADVVTYTVVKTADRSWCRLPENGFWNTACFPTPDEENAGVGDFPALAEQQVRASCFVPDTAPDEVLLIECGLLGMQIYDAEFWDADNRPRYWVTGQTKYPVWFR